MNCRKCHKEIPEPSAFCMYCGAKQVNEKGRHRRGNGQGTAYKRGNTWTASVLIGWKAVDVGEGEPPRKIAVKRSKGGFSTKKDALAFCPTLLEAVYAPERTAPQLITYYETYETGEMEKLSDSKQVAYRGAWKKLAPLHYRLVNQITVAELRELVASVAPSYYTARDCKTLLTRLFELAGADGVVFEGSSVLYRATQAAGKATGSLHRHGAGRAVESVRSGEHARGDPAADDQHGHDARRDATAKN